MSQAHKGSRLVAIGQLKSVSPETVFLAHYDITEKDVLSGVSPNASDVFTLRPQEGRFGGGIAVEEETANLVKNGGMEIYSTSYNPGWDTSLNGTNRLTDWSFYNPGVASANVGYHANTNIDRFGYPVIEFVDMNSAYGQKHRWLGVSQQFTTNISGNNWVDGIGVTVSMDVMVDNIDKGIKFGLYHLNSGNTEGFHGSQTVTKFCTKTYQWERISETFTVNISNGDWNPTTWCRLYVYGHFYRNDAEGIAWVKNIQIENKGFPTSFVHSNRDKGKLSYPITQYQTVSGWWKVNTISNEWQRIIGCYENPAIYPHWYLSYEYGTGGDIRLRLRDGSIGDSHNSISFSKSEVNTVDGKWHFFAVVLDKDNQKIGLMIDDKYREQAYPNVPTNFALSNYLDIGWARSNGGEQLNGLFDELRIDNRAVSVEELLSWYYSGSPFSPRGIYTIAY